MSRKKRGVKNIFGEIFYICAVISVVFSTFAENPPFFCISFTKTYTPLPLKLWKGWILTNRKNCDIIKTPNKNE